MIRRLARVVYLEDPDTRRMVVLRPGEDVPGWAAALITSPLAWEPARPVDGEGEPKPGGDDAQTADTEPVEAGAGARPAGNASRADWATYAQAAGVAVSADMGRDEIIAAVDAE